MGLHRIFLGCLCIGLLHAEGAAFDLWKRWKDLGQRPAPAEVERAARTLDLAETLDLNAWAWAVGGDARSLLDAGDAVLARHRERLVSAPLATLLYLEALHKAGRGAEARRLLASIPGERGSVLQAALATGAAILSEDDRERMQKDLEAARRLLAHAVPEPAYETWQSREIASILERIERKARQARELSELGADFLAWQAADRLAAGDSEKGLAALRGILVRDPAPHPRIAAAARLEVARILGETHLWTEARETLLPLLQPDAPLRPLALCRLGDLAAASGSGVDAALQAWQAAFDALPAVGSETVPDVTPAALARLLPDAPLQRLDSWGCPTWSTRGPGQILDPSLAPWVADHVRYQIALRLAVAHAASGNRRVAVALARSLLLVSPIDRALADRQEGAGSAILAASLESGAFPIPVDGWELLAPADRLCAMLALGFYQIYDWHSSRWWSGVALERIPRTARMVGTSLRLLAARSVQMLGERQRAEAMLAEVVLAPGERPCPAWFKAQEARFQLAMGDAKRREEALRILQAVRDRAPGTEFARDALLHQAQFCMGFDRSASRALFLEFQKRYPDQFTSAVRHWLSLLEQPLEASP